jgi:hypothetical protein
MVNAPEPHSRQQPPNDASPSQLVAGRPDKGPDSHLKQERSGIECPTVVGVGFSRTGRCGREDVAELGALDVPTVQYILPAGNRPVLDGGEDRGLAQASRLRSFRRRENMRCPIGSREANGAGMSFQIRLHASVQTSAVRTRRNILNRKFSGTWTSAQTRMSNAVVARVPRSFSKRSRQACARANCWAIC